MRSLWYADEKLHFIDQRALPASLAYYVAENECDVAFAIADMVVRGAPAIGCAAAFGMALAENPASAASVLKATRPTAHDLFHAVDRMLEALDRGEDAVTAAQNYTEDIVRKCKKIGERGARLVSRNARVLTHCNAGALATVDYGTALAPLRAARARNPFVWVDETRPRLQGLLTAWELEQEGIDHAVIADNAAAYFMASGDVDLVIVGADRIARNYDVANKIGTYEKALAARAHDVPFYVAAPLSTFDGTLSTGKDIVIEERSPAEVLDLYTYKPARVRNPAFDVTPRACITGIITENGILKLEEGA
jgi:S-methyl-5-thioribose-1-phosphate isomerase